MLTPTTHRVGLFRYGRTGNSSLSRESR